MVGHAPTLEGSVRQLIGGTPKSLYEFSEITRKVDFLSTVSCEKDINTNKWKIVTPLPLIKNFNIEFDPAIKKKMQSNLSDPYHTRSNPNLNQLNNSTNRRQADNSSNSSRNVNQSNVPLLHSRSSPNIVNPNMNTPNRQSIRIHQTDYSMGYKTQNYSSNNIHDSYNNPDLYRQESYNNNNNNNRYYY